MSKHDNRAGPYKVVPVDDKLPSGNRWKVAGPGGCLYVGPTPMGAQVEADLLNAAYTAGRASIPDPAALVAALRQCVEAMESALGELSPLVMNGERVRKCNAIRTALSAAKAAMGEA